MSPFRGKDRNNSKDWSSGKGRKKANGLEHRPTQPHTVRKQSSGEKSMKLIVKPNWDEIEGVRNTSSEFFRSHGFSGDAVNALTMVISELVENGIKYGDFRTPENNVILTIHIGPRIVTVQVINPVDETAYDHLKRLDRTIQWIRGYQDPFQAYTERIREVSKRPLHDKESGLGLVRIAYEGKSILDFFVGEDNILNVSAVSMLEKDFGR